MDFHIFQAQMTKDNENNWFLNFHHVKEVGECEYYVSFSTIDFRWLKLLYSKKWYLGYFYYF